MQAGRNILTRSGWSVSRGQTFKKLQEDYMGRIAKRMRLRRGLLRMGNSLVDGGVAPILSRRGAGRLGRALAESRKEKPSAPKKPRKPKKKQQTSTKTLARRENEAGQTTPRRAAPPKTAVARKSAKKKNRRRRPPAITPPPVSRPDRARQRQAKAAAKLSRIRRTGLNSRVLGHVSARGKRAQARRDSKNVKG